MPIQSLGMMGSFLGGAVAKYIWIRPVLNSSGLKTLAKGGLWGIALQIAAVVIGNAAIMTLSKLPIVSKQKELEAAKQFTVGYFATVIAGIPVSIVLGQRLGMKITAREAKITALLSTIGFFLPAFASARKRT